MVRPILAMPYDEAMTLTKKNMTAYSTVILRQHLPFIIRLVFFQCENPKYKE